MNRHRITITALALCCVLTTGGKINTDKSVRIDGFWGRHSVTYAQAVKRLPFHILLPTNWKPQDCEFSVRWVRHEGPNADAGNQPDRAAVAIQQKGDGRFLIIETKYNEASSEDDNVKGMRWILGNGYFTRDEDNGYEERQGHRAGTSYFILSAPAGVKDAPRLQASIR